MTALGDFTAGDVLQASDLNQFNNVTALRRTTNQSFPASTFVTVTFGAGTETADVSGWHDTSTNSERITPDIAGLYLVTYFLETDIVTFNARLFITMDKNGAAYQVVNMGSPGYPSAGGSSFITMNGTTDYISMRAWQNSGTSGNISRAELSMTLLRTT